VVTAGGIAFLALTTNLAEVKQSIAGAAPLWSALAIALLIACFYFGAWRWRRLLLADGVDVGRREPLLIYYEAAFFGLFLPSAVGGDVFRGWRIHAAIGGTRKTVINLVVERVVGLTAIGSLGLIAVALAPPLGAGVLGGLLITSLAVIAGAVVLLTPAVGRVVSRIAARLHLARVSTALARISEQIGGYRQDRATLAAVLALSFAQHLVVTAAVGCAAVAVGIDLPLDVYVAAVPVLTILSLAPSIAGIGPREIGLAFVLESAGASPGASVAAAALLLAGILSRGLIGGAIYLLRRPR
jgi:hypothetical protein